MIAAGEPAPDFTLRDQDGEEVSLADFKGRKVLLVFYPFDFSPVCSDQLSLYQEVKPEIEAKGVTHARRSASTAPTRTRPSRRSSASTPRCWPTSSPRARSRRAYGSYLDGLGIANRTLVLIDEDGKVEWAYESPTPGEFPGANVIFDALASPERASASDASHRVASEQTQEP